MNYITIKKQAEGRYEEKRSEFIGHIAPVKSAEEAVAFVELIKSQNRKARHNVYAYIVREDGAVRYSDDGEPQGTGGVPVLDVLRKQGLTDVCVVVTRYFGGILLGANGLVRAYSSACAEAVNNAGKMYMKDCSRLEFSLDYTLYGKVSFLLPACKVIMEKEDFADKVNISLLVCADRAEELKAKLIDATNGSVSLSETTELSADFGAEL